MNFKEFFKECVEKDVFKNLSIYIVSSWVLIQVFSTIWEPFGLPKISMTYLLLVLLVGFPFYVYLLWKYSLKPKESKLSQREGLKVSSKSSATYDDTRKLKKRKVHLPGIHFYSPFQKMYFTALFIITLIAVFSASVIVKANFVNQENMSVFTFPEEPDNKRIAVLPFENNTSDKNLDVIGKMAVDWIMHGITQNKIGEVISPQIVEDYTSVLKASLVPSGEHEVLKAYLKPSKVVTGTYYLNNDKLLLQCSVMDGNMNRTLVSFEVTECSPDSPLDCIEAVKQRVLGYLLSKDKAVLVTEETPPNFKAYKLWLESDELSRRQAPEQLNYINQAIAADSSFFQPKLDRVAYYYNRDQFAVADSLLQILKEETGSKREQLNMINHYEACFKGDNKMAFKTYGDEYSISPDEIDINMSYMVLALQFVNQPQAVDSIYNQIDMKDFDMDVCVTCEYRYFVKGMANLELDMVSETIETLEPFARTAGHEWIKEVLMKAYVKNEDEVAVSDLLEHIRLLGRIEYWEVMMLKTGLEYLKIGKSKEAGLYLDELLAFFKEKENTLSAEEQALQAEAYFYAGNFTMSQEIFERHLATATDDISSISYLAMSYFKDGQESKASMTIERLHKLRSRYQFGDVDYAFARYYAVTGQEDISLEYLLKAVAAGKRFTSTTFQNDLLFKSYKQLPAFRKILTFWLP